MAQNDLASLIQQNEEPLLNDWLKEQAKVGSNNRVSSNDLKNQSVEFLKLLGTAAGGDTNIDSGDWEGMKQLLASVSRARALQGFTPSETARFVFSVKQPIFDLIQKEYGKDAKKVASTMWAASTLLDNLGLFTTEIYQRSREDVIKRQQMELLELSTPVVKIWDKIVAVPLIGTLDSARTQVVMESLLQKIVEEGAEVAIIDITGVPTVDTLVAQHLIKTVAASRLMGAECIISGIRSQIAQTIVHLGIDLADVTTKATLADAITTALKSTGLAICPAASAKAQV